MCRDGWCSARALQLLSELLEALHAGELPQLALCKRLGEAVHASAAIYVRIDTASHRCTSTGWPHTVDVSAVSGLAEHLSRDGPWSLARLAADNAPSSISSEEDLRFWRGSVPDLLLWEWFRYGDVARLPLEVTADELRLVMLISRRRFTARDIHVLRTTHRPLVAFDHVLETLTQDASSSAPAAYLGRNQMLTPREQEVLGMVAEGMLARTIAARMNVSPRTVHKHLGNVYRKLEAHDRLLAVARAQSLGLLPGRWRGQQR